MARRTCRSEGASHSAFSDLSGVGTDRLFAGVAFDKMQRPGSTHVQHAGVERVSGSFHAHREPRQSTRFGARRDNSFSRFNDGTFPMRLPSGTPGACALPAATSLRFTPLGSRRTRILALTAFISSPTAQSVIFEIPAILSLLTNHLSRLTNRVCTLNVFLFLD
jgi:hypothetical protein